MDSLNGAVKTPPGIWIPYPYVRFQPLYNTLIFRTVRLWRLYLATARENDRGQIRRQAVQGTNCALEHLTTGLEFGICIVVLFVG